MPVFSPATSTIVSQAFRFMELSPVSSFGDDSDEARAAAEAYPDALRLCLEFADWSFASVTRQLHAATGADVAADDALPYFYYLPPDLVMVREMGDGLGTTIWRRDAEGLRADDAGPLRIRFTKLTQNEASLPAMFRTAVAYHLAGLLGPRYGLPASKLQRITDEGGRALATAASKDARQASDLRYDGRPDQGDWVTGATL